MRVQDHISPIPVNMLSAEKSVLIVEQAHRGGASRGCHLPLGVGCRHPCCWRRRRCVLWRAGDTGTALCCFVVLGVLGRRVLWPSRVRLR